MQITGILKTSREEKIISDTDNLPKLLIYKRRVSTSLGAYISGSSCREGTGLNAEVLSRAAMNRLYCTVRIVAC